jgi:hypothetical protein
MIVVSCEEQTKEPEPVPQPPEIPVEPDPNPNPDPDPNPGLPFTEYSLEGTSARWVNIAYNSELPSLFQGKLLVINSDEELKKYIEGDYPPIDFTKKTLLLAFGDTPRSSLEIKNISFNELSVQNYLLSVDIDMGDALAFDFWTVAILLDKLNEEAKIELNTVINNNNY